MAIADDGASTAGVATITEIIVTHAVGTLFTFVTDPVRTLNALLTATLADHFAVFTAPLTALADDDAATAQTAVVTESVETIAAHIAAILTDL